MVLACQQTGSRTVPFLSTAVAFYYEPYCPIQERLVLYDGKGLGVYDRVIGGGTSQLYDGKKHDIHIVILVFVLADHGEKEVVNISVGIFSG